MLAVMRDRQDGQIAVSFHQDDLLPAHKTDLFDSIDDAMAAHNLDWADPDDDADGDVIKTATA